MPPIFWVSAEVHQPAFEAFNQVRLAVEPHLNAAFSACALAEMDAMLCYVPIVMPVEMHDRYPDRSELQRKTRIYDCTPHLDCDLFVSGRFDERVREFLRGVATSQPFLSQLGATDEQVSLFALVLSQAPDQIVGLRRDQTRH